MPLLIDFSFASNRLNETPPPGEALEAAGTVMPLFQDWTDVGSQARQRFENRQKEPSQRVKLDASGGLTPALTPDGDVLGLLKAWSREKKMPEQPRARYAAASSMRHHWIAEEIDPTDRAGLLTWARDICHGLDIDVAAKAVNVAPTEDAVVDALTNSLPEAVREEVANVCFEALGRNPQP